MAPTKDAGRGMVMVAGPLTFTVVVKAMLPLRLSKVNTNGPVQLPVKTTESEL